MVLVPLHFGRGVQKCPNCLTLEIHVLLTWDMVQKFMQIKTFKRCPEGCVHCPNFADGNTFVTIMTDFLENQDFSKFLL